MLFFFLQILEILPISLFFSTAAAAAAVDPTNSGCKCEKDENPTGVPLNTSKRDPTIHFFIVSSTGCLVVQYSVLVFSICVQYL